jgi:acetyl-CoA carboxylase biotin carboxyl carrier protein
MVFMDFDENTKILEMMREHELSEFELERDKFKLRIRKHTGTTWTTPAPYPQQGPVAMPSPVPGVGAAVTPAVPEPQVVDDEELELAVVKSPIVGTFYSAPEPGAKPFAEVGQMVKKGQVLCIIEAMKLMNEINAEVDGELVKVYVENSQAVQYGERLFAIRPANS